jgi:hypothetical protein
MRLSWYADTGVAVFSIWQGGTCTGTFRLPIADLPRMVEALQRGPVDMPEGPPGEQPSAQAAGRVRPAPRGARPAMPDNDVATGQQTVAMRPSAAAAEPATGLAPAADDYQDDPLTAHSAVAGRYRDDAADGYDDLPAGPGAPDPLGPPGGRYSGRSRGQGYPQAQDGLPAAGGRHGPLAGPEDDPLSPDYGRGPGQGARSGEFSGLPDRAGADFPHSARGAGDLDEPFAGYAGEPSGGFHPEPSGGFRDARQPGYGGDSLPGRHGSGPPPGYGDEPSGDFPAEPPGGFPAEPPGGGYLDDPRHGYGDSSPGRGVPGRHGSGPAAPYSDEPSGGFHPEPPDGYLDDPRPGYGEGRLGRHGSGPPPGYGDEPSGGFPAEPPGGYLGGPQPGYGADPLEGDYPTGPSRAGFGGHGFGDSEDDPDLVDDLGALPGEDYGESPVRPYVARPRRAAGEPAPEPEPRDRRRGRSRQQDDPAPDSFPYGAPPSEGRQPPPPRGRYPGGQ